MQATSKTEILWFLDRFGLPGRYRLLWAQMAKEAGISPTTVKFVSMHSLLSGTLLTRYASRKAPTWVPEREAQIQQAIRTQIKLAGPGLKAVVLAAPEVLCRIGLHPENATLNKLRGSVYDIEGIPHVVMLPMSAWLTQVTSKDIGAANYGLESGEALSASAAAVTAALNSKGVEHDGRTTSGLRGPAIGDRHSGESASQLSGQPAADLARVSATDSGSAGTGGLGADDRIRNLPADGEPDLLHVAGIRSGHAVDDRVANGAAVGARGVLRRTGDSDLVGHGFRKPDRLGLTGAGRAEAEADDERSEESVEAVEGESDDVEVDDDDFDVDDSDPDAFWYEPVMVPVGKMMLRFDSRKLARIVNGQRGSFFDAI